MRATILRSGLVSGLFLLLVPGGDLAAEPGLSPPVGGDAVIAAASDPTVILRMPPATRTLSVTIKLPTTDPGGSGIAGYFLSQDPDTPGLHATGWRSAKPAAFKVSSGQGSKTVYAWVKTRDGQISARASDTTILDQRDPTVTLAAPSETTSRQIAVTVDGADDPPAEGVPVSGIAAWAVVNGTTVPAPGSAAWKSSPPTSHRLSFGNGTKTISAFSRDAAGNVSAPATTTLAMTLAGPSLTLSLPAVTNKRTVNLTVTASDPGGTGIAGYWFSQSGTTPLPGATGWVLVPNTFKLAGIEGVKRVYGWVRDSNGSVSARVQADTLLDLTPPLVTLDAPTTATSQQLPVTLGGSDPEPAEGQPASGITAWAVVNGTTVPAPGSAAWKATPPTTLTLSAGNGVKTFSAFARDAAGNVSAAATRTTTIGLLPPTLTFSMPTYTKTARVSVTLDRTDNSGTGIAGFYLSESPSTPAANGPGWVFPSDFTLSAGDGTHTVYAWVKDNNGSISERVQDDTFLDTVRPTASLAAPDASRTTAIAVTVGSGDGSGSGVTHWAIINGTTEPAPGAPAWKTSAPTTYTLPSGDGAKVISAFTRDAARNVSLAATRTVILDAVRPTATLTAPAVTAVRTIGITLGGNDGSGSGISHWAVVEGTGAPAAGSAAWVVSKPTSFQVSAGDGTKTVSAFSRDVAGNVSNAASQAVLLDTTSPTVTLSAPSAAGSRTIWVSLGGSDGSGSGISHWAVVEGTAEPASGDAAWVAGSPTSFQVSAGDGAKTVSAFSRDAAGNVSSVVTRSVTVDTVRPTVTLSAPSESASRTIAVTLDGADIGTGISRWAVVGGTTAPSSGSSAWVASKPTSFQFSVGDGSRTVSAFSRDAAGNVSLAASETVLLDATAPSVTLVAPSSTTTRTIGITLTGSDGTGTGISHWAVVEGTGAPASGDAAWVTSKPTTFELSVGDGTKTVSAFARDAFGHVSDAATQAIILDTTAPSVTLAAPGSTVTRTIVVDLGGSDGSGTGISHWAVVEGAGAPAPGDAAWVTARPTSFQLSDGDGTKTVSAFGRDQLGHVSTPTSTTVTLTTP